MPPERVRPFACAVLPFDAQVRPERPRIFQRGRRWPVIQEGGREGRHPCAPSSCRDKTSEFRTAGTAARGFCQVSSNSLGSHLSALEQLEDSSNGHSHPVWTIVQFISQLIKSLF